MARIERDYTKKDSFILWKLLRMFSLFISSIMASMGLLFNPLATNKAAVYFVIVLLVISVSVYLVRDLTNAD